jgi:thiol-disulfide isomerase/thioredoxin
MTSRLLAMFGLVGLMVGLASAQEKKDEVKEKPSVKAQVKEALETADENLPKAIGILEKLVKDAPDEKTAKRDPDERTAIYLLGAMTAVQGQKAEDKAERIAMFRKSAAAFAKLQRLHKDLTDYEKRFLTLSKIGEARVLASEGKPEPALAAIKQAIDGGFDDLDAIEKETDLEPVRKLPQYKELTEAIRLAKIEEEKKELEEARKAIPGELASFKSFPFDFKLKDTNDKPVSLADYKGKVTIVDVWGTWCPPCRMEIPHFVDLYKEYKAKGLEIVGINCNEQGTPEQVKKKIKDFAKETNISYTCVLNDEKTEEKIPGFQGYPTTLFLDRSGKVRMMLVGYTSKGKLEAIVTTLLADASTPDGAKAK